MTAVARRDAALHPARRLPSVAVRGLVAAMALIPLLALGGQLALAQEPDPATSWLQPVDEGPIAWRRSFPVGATNHGFLVRGVQLPAEGEDFFSWDPILGRAPNRPWRRWGADTTIRTLLRVLAAYRAAFPDAARVGIADLSRPNGGPFGPRYGGLGHASHQTGLDVDIYYPRRDRRERSIAAVSQIDRDLAIALIKRFVRAGAVLIFVGPDTKLRGKRGVVQRLVHHDDHMHVRFGPRRGARLP
jgi:murein endopeptidase